jgi:hypothetical protein
MTPTFGSMVMQIILALFAIFGVLLAPAQEIKIKRQSGEVVAQKVTEAIAGKVILLPGDITLVEGQPLWLTLMLHGAPSQVKFFVGFSELTMSGDLVKSTSSSGAVVVEYQDQILLPEGEWKVSVVAQNAKGFFSDTIRVRVLKKVPLTECCPDILK